MTNLWNVFFIFYETFSSYFPHKTGFDISCKLSPMETICMKYQNQFCLMLPIKFWLNPTYGLGGDLVWRISRWPLWRPSWILEWKGFSNSVSLLLRCPPSFRLNLNYGLGGDVVWRISRRLPWWPSWISERNNFCNSESICHCDVFHQVLAQSDLRFGRICRLKNFKTAVAVILDIGTEWF